MTARAAYVRTVVPSSPWEISAFVREQGKHWGSASLSFTYDWRMWVWMCVWTGNLMSTQYPHILLYEVGVSIHWDLHQALQVAGKVWTGLLGCPCLNSFIPASASASANAKCDIRATWKRKKVGRLSPACFHTTPLRSAVWCFNFACEWFCRIAIKYVTAFPDPRDGLEGKRNH